jgi:hypothetical protein
MAVQKGKRRYLRLMLLNGRWSGYWLLDTRPNCTHNAALRIDVDPAVLACCIVHACLMHVSLPVQPLPSVAQSRTPHYPARSDT